MNQKDDLRIPVQAFDTSECFGKGESGIHCTACIYAEACRYAYQDHLRTRAEDNRWLRSSEYADHYEPHPDDLPVDLSDERKMYSRDEVVALSAFLLRVGRDRKLGKILKAKLMGARSFAEIARKEGVTRQAIHKRVGKQLAKLFGFKERRLTDSRLLSLEPDEFRIVKMSRSGFLDEEIEDCLEVPHRQFIKMKEKIDWKLMHWT